MNTRPRRAQRTQRAERPRALRRPTTNLVNFPKFSLFWEDMVRSDAWGVEDLSEKELELTTHEWFSSVWCAEPQLIGSPGLWQLPFSYLQEDIWDFPSTVCLYKSKGTTWGILPWLTSGTPLFLSIFLRSSDWQCLTWETASTRSLSARPETMIISLLG